MTGREAADMLRIGKRLCLFSHERSEFSYFEPKSGLVHGLSPLVIVAPLFRSWPKIPMSYARHWGDI